MGTWQGHAKRRTREACFAAYGTDCWVCGHPGAYEVDHVRRRVDGGDPYDVANTRPAHGSSAPCPVCISVRTGRARCCNQERNGATASAVVRTLSVDPRTL